MGIGSAEKEVDSVRYVSKRMMQRLRGRLRVGGGSRNW